MELNIFQLIYTSIITTAVWFILGGILYMNPFIAKIYKKYHKHPSMKHFSNQKNYLTGVFFVAGFIPIILILFAYQFIVPINWIIFGFILFMFRIIPRFCDMWMQTSYPNTLLIIELINGLILSFIIAFMFQLII